MRFVISKALAGAIFATLAAGAWSTPAVAASSSKQDGATAPVHKAHKKSSSASAKKPTTTTSNAKKAAGGTTAKKTSASGRPRRSKRVKKVKGQEAPTPERINEIQEALASKGAFTGTPTGKWDDSTVDAMKKFQASHGLEPTGKLDALTLQKLGLGSQTAGLAPPTAPPNSTNRLRNTSSAPAEEQPRN